MCLWLGLAVSAFPAETTPLQACSPGKLDEVLAPATAQHRSVSVDCWLTLASGARVTKQIIFAGKAASGAALSCNGATLDGGPDTINGGRDMIVIRSQAIGDPPAAWSAPSDIEISGCTVLGSIRIYGMSQNGEGEQLRLSSVRDAAHTQRAQSAAPTRITFQDMTIEGATRIAFYVGPGSTHVTLRRSSITGWSNGPAIYLDAESAFNIIADNRIDLRTRSRELLAVDGSKGNTITGNAFAHADRGGAFVYRNCGEGGTVRHQAPTGNVISGNAFSYDGLLSAAPAVWLGSRNAISLHCREDDGYAFGSSVDDGDEAAQNRVEGNRVQGRALPYAFVGDEQSNVLRNNR